MTLGHKVVSKILGDRHSKNMAAPGECDNCGQIKPSNKLYKLDRQTSAVLCSSCNKKLQEFKEYELDEHIRALTPR